MTFMWRLCTNTHSTEAVKPAVNLSSFGCRESFVLVSVVAHSFLLKWSDRSHYRFSKCFCSVSFLICHASWAVRGPQSFPQSLSRFLSSIPVPSPRFPPKWPPTPAMTLLTILTGAPTVIGPASGKSTLTSLINWMYWPLLSEWRGYGAVG